MNELLEDIASMLSAPRGELDLLDAEQRLRERVAQVTRMGMQAVLASLDVDAPAVLIGGVEHRRAGRCEASYLTAAGEVRVMRTLYRVGKERTTTTVDVLGGVVDGWITPVAAEVACFVVAETTPQMAVEMLAKAGGMRVSRSTLDRLPKLVSEEWESRREEHERTLRREIEIPKDAAAIGVSLDGVMVPMKGDRRACQRAARRAEGRPPSGPAGYREASCGSVSFYDDEGKRLETLRLGRMPESGKRTLKSSLRALVTELTARRPDLHIVKVADGARDNWSFLAEALPKGDEVLDYFHAVEHLGRGLAAAYGEGSLKYQQMHKRLRRKLRDDDDGVEKVIRALRYQSRRMPENETLKTELRYFRRNRHRMRYADLAARNLPIGSGVVEATCKTLVSVRMKRSGMRWSALGGQAILTLRALQQSGQFDLAWEQLHRRRPGEVVPLRESPLAPHLRLAS